MKPIFKNPRTGPFVISGSPARFPFGAVGTVLTNNARGAIAAGVCAIGLQTGDTVLIPAWTCGSELDALEKSGLQIQMYGLNPDLTAKIEDINLGLEQGAKAVYLIHYFGYPQPVEEVVALAKSFDAKVIEDLALGLFSTDDDGASLGRSADMSVFSLVKTLNLPDGGALWLREGAAEPLAGSKLSGKSHAVFLKKQVSKAKKSIAQGSSETEASLDTWNTDADFKGIHRISKLSRTLVRRCDLNRLVPRRRTHYDALFVGLSGLQDIAPLMGPRPKGAVPAYFPLVAEDARGVSQALRQNQIEPVRFWRRFYPGQTLSDHPHIEKLKRAVIRLPIHHDMTDEDTDRIIDVVRQFS